MARITVRNVDESVMRRLRERGAARGVSMEQEARDVLAASVGLPTTKGFELVGHCSRGRSQVQTDDTGARVVMGTLTIRNLDDDLKQKLRERAARHGVSMEQEARNLLLKDVAATKERDGDFVTAEEILEFGRRLQQADFDQKKFTDDLWSFIEEE